MSWTGLSEYLNANANIQGLPNSIACKHRHLSLKSQSKTRAVTQRQAITLRCWNQTGSFYGLLSRKRLNTHVQRFQLLPRARKRTLLTREHNENLCRINCRNQGLIQQGIFDILPSRLAVI